MISSAIQSTLQRSLVKNPKTPRWPEIDQKRGSYVVEVCNMQNLTGLVIKTGQSERIDSLCIKSSYFIKHCILKVFRKVLPGTCNVSMVQGTNKRGGCPSPSENLSKSRDACTNSALAAIVQAVSDQDCSTAFGNVAKPGFKMISSAIQSTLQRYLVKNSKTPRWAEIDQKRGSYVV